MSLFDLKELRGINGWPNSNSMHVDRSWERCDCNWGRDHSAWERCDLSDMAEGRHHLLSQQLGEGFQSAKNFQSIVRTL